MIVKVCGMREAENIRALEKTDIDWMGFIFFSGSPRFVPEEDKCSVAVQNCTKVRVGVFVNEAPAEILRKYAKYKLNYVQLHGDESPDFCRQLRDAGCHAIKAFSVASANDLQQTAAYEPFTEFFLFDTKGNERGGTGKRFDWSILDAYKGNTPFLLSGGIDTEHLSDLLEFCHPQIAGIDLNSRFELSPALKNIEKIEKFITQLKKEM